MNTFDSILAEAAASPMLDPPTRAVLLMALLAFVILGLGLIVGVLLGGRWVRRLGGDDLRKPLPLRRAADSDEQVDKTLAGIGSPHWGRTSDTARLDTAAETKTT